MILNRLSIETNIQGILDRDKVYALLGYKKGRTELPQRMIELIEETIDEASQVIEPVGTHIIRQIDKKGEAISILDSDIRLEGRSVGKLLKNSFAVLFMAVTIGPELEHQIDRYNEERKFEKALILDAVGSEEVEAAANALNHYLLVLARQSKMALTRRFSPGYGDLPLQFQARLHEELALSSLGVSIDDRFFLWPRKTVTALLGVER